MALFFWENKKEEQQITNISRNETLSRLPVRLSTNRITELVQLRDITRPVILAGSKASVTQAMQRAERYRTELLKRGVLLIPVIFGASQKAQIKPKGFGTTRSVASAPSIEADFEKRTESIAAKSRLRAEVRFKADSVSPEQWERSNFFSFFLSIYTFNQVHYFFRLSYLFNIAHQYKLAR